MAVISNLKAIRKSRKCSQAQLAAATGICIKTISNIECERSLPSLEVALLIAGYLDTDVRNLFTIKSEEQTGKIPDKYSRSCGTAGE